MKGNYWLAGVPREEVDDSPLPRGGVDIAIIGGGLNGTTVFNALEHTNLKVCLLESQGGVGMGSSGRGPGIATWFNECSVSDAAMRFSADSINMLRRMCNRSDILVDFRPKGHIYCSSGQEELNSLISKIVGVADEQKETFETFTPDEMLAGLSSEKFNGGLVLPSAFSVNPHKLTQFLARSAESSSRHILTHAMVESVEKVGNNFKLKIRDRGTITARKVVYCNGARVRDFVGELSDFLSLYVSHCVATDTMQSRYYHALPPHSVSHRSRWFRLTKGRMIMGETLPFDNETFEENSKNALRRTASILYDTFPLLETNVEFAWSSLVCGTKDALPLIGPLPNRENEYVFTGSMSSQLGYAVLGGMMMADYLVSGHTKIENANIFAPEGRIDV